MKETTLYHPEEIENAEQDLHRIQWFKAAADGDMATMRSLIRLVSVNSIEPDGMTALHLAIAHQHERAVRFLLEHGANVNAQDFVKRGTPLLAAAVLRFSSLGILLLESGADPNLASSEGIVPLHFAAQLGLPSLTKELIMRKANVEAADYKGGIRPLHRAAMGDHLLCVENLLKAGASVDALTRDGESAVHFCAQLGKKPSVLDELLRAGANINLRSSETFSTPLDMAIRADNTVMVRWLQERGGVRSIEQRIIVPPRPRIIVPPPGSGTIFYP